MDTVVLVLGTPVMMDPPCALTNPGDFAYYFCLQCISSDPIVLTSSCRNGSRLSNDLTTRLETVNCWLVWTLGTLLQVVIPIECGWHGKCEVPLPA